jgi:hypothetical protein|tara:strand:+ start:43 stop:624 length:582 start_codon:yes stop_codon:yes gene_type:complete
MKVKTIIKILEAIEGKLPIDMYELADTSYLSHSKQEMIPITEMDTIHLIRAFKNDRRKREEIEDYKKQINYWKKLAEDNFISSVDDLDENEIMVNHLTKEVDKHKDRIRYLERCIDNNMPKGDVKMFSEIPNDSFGQRLVEHMKLYLNKDSYKMRVRGQYLKEDVKETEGWRRYDRGQPLSKSKCIRVYVDVK